MKSIIFIEALEMKKLLFSCYINLKDIFGMIVVKSSTGMDLCMCVL